MKQVQDQGTWKHVQDQMGMDALSSFYINKTDSSKKEKKKPHSKFSKWIYVTVN